MEPETNMGESRESVSMKAYVKILGLPLEFSKGVTLVLH
jgi:hypothetical protein